MPFGTATVVTNKGKAMFADRVRTSPSTYLIAPAMCAMGVGATGAGRTAAATDTGLSGEVESRVVGAQDVVTITNVGDAYQVSATIVATDTRNVDEFGVFDSAGVMFLSATFPVEALLAGQSLHVTVQAQLA